MQEKFSGPFSGWSKGDLLSLAQVLLATLALLGSFLVILWGWILRTWLTEKRLVRKFGADLYLPEDIGNATRYYVRPDATNIDLAQEMEEGHNIIVVREDLFKSVDRFLVEESAHHHMILLADSGMGKSAFVLNYYDYNRRKWWRGHKLAVIPLGVATALEKIKEIPKKNETILFLDAFDEDPGARHDYKQRLDELMKACIEFRRVLITCRTQFFPKDADIPTVAGLVFTPRPGQAQHTFWRLYLAPFSNQQVDTFLRRRFKFWSIKKKRKARDLAEKVPKLIVRPMLLLHIPDLLQAEKPVTSAWDIYQILTEKWYEREIGFWKDKEVLRRFSEEVAVEFYLNFRKDGSDRVPRETIVSIIEKIKPSKATMEDSLNDIDEWRATGRSLLHRDADGNWKFAHRSIMELLFLNKFFEGDPRCRSVSWTDQMKKFAIEYFHARSKLVNYHDQFSGADLSGADLSGADLIRANLIRANLTGVDFNKTVLHQADLSGANLSGANLSRANLSGANLSGANLSGANLSGANLKGVDLTGADLTGIDLSGVDFSRIHLSGVDFSGAILSRANLSGADLSGANLKGVDLSRADLTGKDLSRANLSGAMLAGAILSRTIFAGAILRGADLSGANLRGAVLHQADLHGADLSGANFSEANLGEADLNEANLSGANLWRVYSLSVFSLLGAKVDESTILQPELAEELKNFKMKGNTPANLD